MEREFTVEERNQIYKLALKKYQISYVGMCYALKLALTELGWFTYLNNPYYHMEIFPEINKYKPKPEDFYGLHWFNQNNHKIRINIFNEAIETT